MKVLLINSVCGFGSTGRICVNLAEEYKKEGNEVVVAYGRGKTEYSSTKRIGSSVSCGFHLVMTRLFDAHGLFSKVATRNFLVWADNYNPDVLWLHNIHGYYINYVMLFEWIKSRPNMQVKWTLHDCWTFTGHCSHFMSIDCTRWQDGEGCYSCPLKKEYPSSILSDNSGKNYYRKKSAFCGVRNLEIIVPSEWLAGEVKKSFLKQYPIIVEKNEIDKATFVNTESNFRIRYGLQDKYVVLGVASKWSEKKGVDDFIRLSKLLSDKYRVVLIGNGLERIKNNKKIQDNRIITIDRTESIDELAKWYSLADVFVNLTYEDNYPTVNLEAEACGTPVITYDTGGCKETISMPRSKVIVKGDLKEVIRTIKKNVDDKTFSQRVLIVMRGFFPGVKYGGPPVSVENIVRMMPETEFYIITTDHDLGEKKRYSGINNCWTQYGDLNNCQVLYCKDSKYGARVFLNAIENLCPDFVYCQSFFEKCVLPLVLITKMKKIPLLIAARGELCQGALSIKRVKKRAYICALNEIHLLDGVHFQATSQEEEEAYKEVTKISYDRVHELTNVPNIGIYDEERICLSTNNKESGKLKMVFYARICKKKNLIFALHQIKELDADIELDIYGSIEDEGYWGDCKKLIAMMPSNIRIKYMGIAKQNESAEILGKYDVFILPTFSENFGHSIGEALAAGCPVIVSDQTPWNDVGNYSAGMSIPLTEEWRYREAIMQFVNMNAEELLMYKNNAAKYIREKIDLDRIKQQYIESFKFISGEK